MPTFARPRVSARSEHDFTFIVAKRQAAAEALARAEAEEAEAAAAAQVARPQPTYDDDTRRMLKLATQRVRQNERDPDRMIDDDLLAALERDKLLQKAVAETNRKAAIRLLDLARRCNDIVETVAPTDVIKMFG